jgi:outer membrane protein OmpA-like peptidoglycan-associated protein
VKNYLSILFLLIVLAACKSTAEIKDGNVAFDLKKHYLAQKLLPVEIAKESNPDAKIKKMETLAKSYELSNNPKKAEEWYQKLLDFSQRPDYHYDLGRLKKQNEKYEEAILEFEQYKALTFDVLRANSEIAVCKEIIEAKNAKSNIFIENLYMLNSEKSDYATAVYRNEALAITSTRSSATGTLIHPWTGDKNSDIFISKMESKRYQNAEKFSDKINTELPEGSITFSEDFKEAYFTRCDYSETKNGYCGIYYTYLETNDKDSWAEPKRMTIFGDTINVGQPFLAPDGKRLYFASDAPFGYGGNDIYFMQKNGDEWSEPFNAGFLINTDKEELFPSVDSKGNLYYSSNGKIGYGGLDIFKATPDKNNFKNPERLPYPINSGADDFMFLFIHEFNPNARDGLLEQAVFSSTRQGGRGSDDVYMYTKRFINYYLLKLYIVEKNYENPIDSESKVLGLKPVNQADVKLSSVAEKPFELNKKTPLTGLLTFELEKETDYNIFVSKNKYFNQNISVSTKNLQNPNEMNIVLYDTVELERIFPEKEIVIPNIYYDYDKATLREESFPVLDKLIGFFNENKDLTIEIGSHTDSRGSDSYNLNLSQRRAQSVVDYFISKGVPSEQLTAKGYGETKIKNRCINNVNCTEEEHQENRRTTFRVVSSSGILESESE